MTLLDGFRSRRRFLKQSLLGIGIASCPGWQRCASAAGAAPDRFPLAICNETFGDWPLEKAFHLAAECGYQGVEIAPFTIANDVRTISTARRAEIRRLCDSNGLKMVGLHWLLAKTKGFHLTSRDAEVRQRTAAYLGALAEFCAELGGKLLVFGSPQQRNLPKGMPFEEGLANARQTIEAALKAFEKTDVTLALEPLSPGTTNFLTTAAEAVQLAEKVNSPRCKLHLDCLAMSTEKSPIPDLIKQYQRWTVHFHANDPNKQGPGFGQLDFVPIFRALAESGYRGWVSVEVFDYKPGPERLARESIQYMRKCLSQIK